MGRCDLKTEWFRERFRGFRAPDNGFGGGRMVHGRPDKRAILVDLVHASGTTIVSRGFVQVHRALAQVPIWG
jgi:hypothetical protein